jgi:hypothetical protein
MTTIKTPHAVGVNFAVQKIVSALAQYQNDFSTSTLSRRLEYERTFGPWVPKRVGITSFI